MVEGQVEGLEAEFKSIVANAVGLFERVKLFVKEIGVMLEGLFGGAGNLKWLKEGSEVEAAMIGETITLVAEIEDIPDGTFFTIKVFEEDDSKRTEAVKEFEVSSSNYSTRVEWKINIDKEKFQDVESGIDHIFTLENEQYNIRDESKPINIDKLVFKITLEIDPNDPAADNDKYTLYSTDGSKTYNKTLTPEDDKVKDDNRITLVYDDIDSGLNYTLEIDQGSDGDKFNLFEDIPWEMLKGYLKKS
jgi:hypothetical protein